MIRDIEQFSRKQKERIIRGKILQNLYLGSYLTYEENKKLRLEQDRCYKMFDFMKKLKIEMEKNNGR